MLLRLRLLVSAFFLLSFSIANAQTVRLSGKVLNEKNEALPGVSVKLVGAAGGTTTDIEGRFTLNLTPGKKYELEFSAVGYKEKSVTEVEVVSGQVNELNIVLSIKATTGDSVIITTKTTARRESAASVISFQKNTNTVASVISAETIRRSPDKTTGEVLRRTPGASIQEGRFLVVRGLADRYNQAMMNGVLLTSTEPDRKTFSFDLIPAPMIDNIVINKAFVPEYPGEWAGGLIQVNTKDIPSKGFFNVQLGTGFNTASTGKDFYKDKGGKLDWLGIDDGTRGYPPGYTTKYAFSILSAEEKTAIGKSMRNAWQPEKTTAPIDLSFQANGGFNTSLFGKRIGANFGIIYGKNNRYLKLLNRKNNIDNQFHINEIETNFNDDRYVQNVTAGALGSLSIQFNPKNKISVRSIVNVNTSNYSTGRIGIDSSRNDLLLQGTEIVFKQNTFFTVQTTGDHTLSRLLKFKWYGAFNILDGYVPDQRRLLYSRVTPTDPLRAVIANSLSQQSGSRIFQSLSDYTYTAGGDLTYNFNWLQQKQTLKGGYMLQIKDRLYDAILFANNLHVDNDALRRLPADQIFAPQNFGNGAVNSNLFSFDAIIGSTYRYLANTILNAGFLQMDNQLTPSLRVVWGLRVENFDQLVGSVKKWDPRHTHTQVTDYLPGLNATLKLNTKTNLRLSGSQTVIRPELRELSFLNLYDFELNASVQGNPNLKRTKVINTDLRYELYPRAGEVFTVGVFYKHFNDPIEQILNASGGGASTFTFQNPESAYSFGAEVEVRKRLDFSHALRNFTLQANAAYVKSKVQDSRLNVSRPLQGQSPYVMNFGLLYDIEKIGLNATILFNRVGERVYLVGDKTAGANEPDTYEAPRSLIDLQFAKKLLKNKAEVKITASDLLNSTQYFYQNVGDENKITFQKHTDAYRFTRRFGTTFSLTFSYSL